MQVVARFFSLGFPANERDLNFELLMDVWFTDGIVARLSTM